jgi:hypothetical protein
MKHSSYHPLSQGDRKAGRTIEEAGARKTESIFGGKYEGYQVIHVARFSELLEIFTQHHLIAPRITKHIGEKLSKARFIQDLSEADRYGHEINRKIAEARERYPLSADKD